MRQIGRGEPDPGKPIIACGYDPAQQGGPESGKCADFAILEEDPCEVDPTGIKDLPVRGTALSGKIYKSDR